MDLAVAGEVPGTLGGSEQVLSGAAVTVEGGLRPGREPRHWEPRVQRSQRRDWESKIGEDDLMAQHPQKHDDPKAQKAWEQQNIRLEW